MYEIPKITRENFMAGNITSKLNRENILKNVIPIMVNRDQAKKEMKGVPTDKTRFVDMKGITSVPMLLINDFEGKIIPVVISSYIMSECNISKKELFSAAYKNNDERPPVIRDMMDIDKVWSSSKGFDAMDRLSIEDIDGNDFHMFFITNEEGFLGAMALLSGDTLRKLGEKLGDFYIIPSSIHEFIILKVEDGMEPEMMTDMIRQVNDNIVGPKETLSYELYKYKVDENKIITCVTDSSKDKVNVIESGR